MTAPQSVVTVMAANTGVYKPAFSGFVSTDEAEEWLELSCGLPAKYSIFWVGLTPYAELSAAAAAECADRAIRMALFNFYSHVS